MTSSYKKYDTTFLSKLPEDLLDYIWSMNHEWAANIIQHVVRSFIRMKVFEITKMIEFACWPCKLGPEIKTYNIFYKNRILNRQDVLNTFSACKCCEKHQKNKPTILSKWEDTTIPLSQHISCECSCRHLSRFICRGVE
tara:strand:+ start:400 stop:816 length:417 start_codon:yes stop_codon:yes gene_type:complete